MKILNLVYPEKSDIKYKISKFPDGQQNIVINNKPDENGSVLLGYYYLAGKSRVYTKEYVQIKSHLNNWLDLELITLVLHTITDYYTSRLNSKLWEQKKVHYFFVSIGFDQVLHYVQLFTTYYYLKTL